MQELDRFLEAMKNLPEEIVEAEAEVEKTEKLFVTRQNRQDSGGGASEIGEIFVRASGEKTGRTYTQHLDADPKELILEACQNAAFSAAAEREQLHEGTGEKCSRSFDEKDFRTTEELKAYAKHLEDEFERSKYEFSPLDIQVCRMMKSIGTVNTKGLYVEDTSLCYQVSVRAVAVHNGDATIAFDLSASKLEDIAAEAVIDRACERVEKHLPVMKGKGGVMPCVLDGSALCNIFFTAWKMFSGQYYVTGKSCLSGCLGKTVSGSGFTVGDYVSCKESGYSFAYDCEGTKGKDVILIEDGVFTGLLHNLHSAMACEMEPTGNAGRKDTLCGVTQTETLITPKNLIIKAGQKPTAQLVEELQDGIYINQSFDEFHSFDFATGEYSIPCEGILVQDGKMEGLMKGITIDGNIKELLEDIIEVGGEVYSFPVTTMDSYTVHAPAIRLKKIKVSCEQ